MKLVYDSEIIKFSRVNSLYSPLKIYKSYAVYYKGQ